jgi:hypothetical protein
MAGAGGGLPASPDTSGRRAALSLRPTGRLTSCQAITAAIPTTT